MTDQTVFEGNELVVSVEGMGDMPAGYINRSLVVEMGDTLMGIHPAAQTIGKIGMRAVAQLALMTGASPLPGTNGIHAWTDNKGKLCIQFGIGFWRGEAEQAGGILWAQRPRPMTADERKAWGVVGGDFASYCKAALKRDAYELMATMRGMGVQMTLKEAVEQTAVEGVGVASSEKWSSGGEYKEAKNGRPIQWTADERAERDLLRKLVPVISRARQNLETGTYITGGNGWDLQEFAHTAPPLPAVIRQMSDEDINTALFDAEPVQPALIPVDGVATQVSAFEVE